jgi:hypothetical protein
VARARLRLRLRLRLRARARAWALSPSLSLSLSFCGGRGGLARPGRLHGSWQVEARVADCGGLRSPSPPRHRVSFWTQQANPPPRRFTVPDYREKLYAQVRVRG